MTWVSGNVWWHCNFPLGRKDASLLKPRSTKVTDLLERFQHLLLHEFQIMSRHLTVLGTWQCSMPDDQGLLPVLRCEDFIVGGGKAIYSLSHPVWINKCDFSRNDLIREFSTSFNLISMLKYKSRPHFSSSYAYLRLAWQDMAEAMVVLLDCQRQQCREHPTGSEMVDCFPYTTQSDNVEVWCGGCSWGRWGCKEAPFGERYFNIFHLFSIGKEGNHYKIMKRGYQHSGKL